MTKKEQLALNVENVIDEYLNGMYDYGEEEYPMMTLEECRDYVTAQIYNIKNFGGGMVRYRDGICDDLKTLGNPYIYSVIDEYASGCGIIRIEST